MEPKVWGNEPTPDTPTTRAYPADVNPDSSSRLPPVRRDELDEPGRAVYDAMVSPGSKLRASLRGPTGFWLHMPEVIEHVRELNWNLRNNELGLARPLRELTILVTARANDCQKEWTAHEPRALLAGMDASIIDIVKHRKPVDGVAEPAATIITFGRELFSDKQVGAETFRLCRALVDDIIRVDTDAMCAAIKDVFTDTRVILEAAGALAIAGAKVFAKKSRLRGQTLVAVASGANMNFDRLRFVAEEAELGEHREAILAVTIPEKPGSFKAFCELLGPRNVTEFNYRFDDPRKAQVFVGVQVQDRDETARLTRALRRAGLKTHDFSDNDLAKLHVRHMVGGHAPRLLDEVVYRFEFPERPGALLSFLASMGNRWNISLFHYRNHGSDYGRVLAGIQVPVESDGDFMAHLTDLGYEFFEETENPAYKMFLSV